VSYNRAPIPDANTIMRADVKCSDARCEHMSVHRRSNIESLRTDRPVCWPCCSPLRSMDVDEHAKLERNAWHAVVAETLSGRHYLWEDHNADVIPSECLIAAHRRFTLGRDS
jgi:hypothetical protein